MRLTTDELSAFAADGIIIRRGLVTQTLAARATDLVSQWYGTMDQSRLIGFTQRTFAPELGSHPDVLALFENSGIAELVGELVGDFVPITTTQIQIRVPEGELEQAQPAKAMHVDGVADADRQDVRDRQPLAPEPAPDVAGFLAGDRDQEVERQRRPGQRRGDLGRELFLEPADVVARRHVWENAEPSHPARLVVTPSGSSVRLSPRASSLG